MKAATQKEIEAFDDTISEADLMAKTNYTKSALRHLRVTGKIKNWSTVSGRKIMYSKSEMAVVLKRVQCK